MGVEPEDAVCCKTARKSGFAGEHERELARDQRNESALTEKAAEDTFLYFYQPKSAKGWHMGECHNRI